MYRERCISVYLQALPSFSRSSPGGIAHPPPSGVHKGGFRKRGFSDLCVIVTWLLLKPPLLNPPLWNPDSPAPADPPAPYSAHRGDPPAEAGSGATSALCVYIYIYIYTCTHTFFSGVSANERLRAESRLPAHSTESAPAERTLSQTGT